MARKKAQRAVKPKAAKGKHGQKKKPTGRPSDFTRGIADTICERLADGESLRSICRGADMPNKATVFRWLSANQSFSDQYARARETQADSLADDVTDIADRTDLEANDKRVRIDARKWLAGKLRPKKYGDKVALVGGGKGDSPIQTLDLTKATDDQLAKLETIIEAIANPGADQG